MNQKNNELSKDILDALAREHFKKNLVKKVLIVDDNENFLEFVKTVLAKSFSGLQIRTALDGAEAVSMIAHQEPDLIVLDLNLPIFNGLVVARTAETLRTIHCPIIFVSANPQLHKVIDGLEISTPHRFLAKPLNKEDLISQVNILMAA